MTLRSRSSSRGAVLIFVLLVLMVLTLAAVAYFQLASANRATALTVTGQQIAAARAEQAAQQAISDVRGIPSLATAVGVLTARGAPNTLADCVTNCVTHATMDGGATLDLSEGGGLLWDYMIYRSSASNPPRNRYNIIGTGYYGYTAASQTYSEARVEVEIDIGSTADGTRPNGDNGQM